MATPFIVLATQRSGSTWLVDMLDSHPRIVAYSELLNEAGRGHPRWGGAKDMPFWASWRDDHHSGACSAGAQTARTEWLSRYLDTVFRARANVQAVGLKLMYDQLAAKPRLYGYMHEHAVHVIHLLRDNLLHVLVSRYLAMASDTFHTRDASPAALHRVRLDPDTVLAQLRAMRRESEAVHATLAARRIEALEVRYEDLVRDATRFDALTEFLGVDPAPVPLASGLRKIVREPLPRVLENHAEVCEALAGTEFEALAEMQ